MSKSTATKYKYNKVWEKEFPWVKGLETGRAFCTHCKVDMIPKLTIIRLHGTTKAHLKKAPFVNKFQPTFAITSVTVKSIETKKLELKMAAFAACHSSYRAMDHLSELVSEAGEGSMFEKVKLHRTKAGALATNVLAPAFKEDLKEDLKVLKTYSILIDETTDFSASKLLAVIVRHWDSRSKRVVDDLLGLVEVLGTTGQELFDTVSVMMDWYGLKFENCVSFASDGASNCAGKHNSVWSRFRDANPSCIQIKCICHSLALVVKHSFEAHIPDSIAFLLHRVPVHFSKSAVRREEFKELQNLMDEGEKSHPFDKYNETRWLARGKVMRNILKNWDILSVYFEAIKNNVPMEHKLEVSKILEILKDRSKFILVTFLVPIVEEFEKLNKKFQVIKLWKDQRFQLYLLTLTF